MYTFWPHFSTEEAEDKDEELAQSPVAVNELEKPHTDQFLTLFSQHCHHFRLSSRSCFGYCSQRFCCPFLFTLRQDTFRMVPSSQDRLIILPQLSPNSIGKADSVACSPPTWMTLKSSESLENIPTLGSQPADAPYMLKTGNPCV